MWTMTSVNVHEAMTHLSRYLKMAQAGERVIICERNVPIVELTPVKPGQPPKVNFGFMGEAEINDEAFAPMTDEEADEWYGP